MKWGNGTSIGLSTVLELAAIVVSVALLIWRLSAGDNFADAGAYATAGAALIMTVVLSVRRTWAGTKEPPA